MSSNVNNNTINNSSDDDLNKDIDILLERYNKKSSDFEKYFAILLGVSLFVLFFMLFPYVTNQILKQNYTTQLVNINQNLTMLNNFLFPLENSITSFNSLRNNMMEGPQDLRNYIGKIAEENQSIIKGYHEQSF